jgi:hypothetical protein
MPLASNLFTCWRRIHPQVEQPPSLGGERRRADARREDEFLGLQADQPRQYRFADEPFKREAHDCAGVVTLHGDYAAICDVS